MTASFAAGTPSLAESPRLPVSRACGSGPRNKSWKRVPEVSELGPQSRPQVKRCTASFSARLLLVSAALFGAVAMALWPRERVAPLGHRLSAFSCSFPFGSMRQALRPLSLGGAYPLSALSPQGWEFSLRWQPFPHIHAF